MIYVAGIDIGSAFSKAVIMAKGRIVSYYVMPTGGDYKLVADEVLRKALAIIKLSLANISHIVATGYGAANVSCSNEVVTDITANGKGIYNMFPSVRTAIDIGGQFTKVFKIDGTGKPISFLLSEKCAAGSGRFLQIIARVLQVELAEIGELSLRSKKKVEFNTGCAVFAESEAISRIAEGVLKEDILAGLHRTLAAKVQTMVTRVGIEADCAVVGGGAKDSGLVKCIEEVLTCKLVVPEEPQIVAAQGAALIAEEMAASIKIYH